jgi:hypothetical protein
MIYMPVFDALIVYLNLFLGCFIFLGVCDVREGCASAPVLQATRLAGKTHRVLQVAYQSMTNLPTPLKGHGNEADFVGFLPKLVPHRSLTLTFAPFRFWLRIRGDFRNRKMTPRLGESGSRCLSDSAFECLKENSASRRVGDSPTRRVGESLW